MRRRRGRFAVSGRMPPWAVPGHALRRPPLRRRLGRLLVVSLMFIAAAFAAARLDPLPPPFGGAASAADGDSLRLAGERVRLLGIDAPELDQTCSRADATPWPCGQAARRRLAELVSVGAVSCRPAGSDRYGRVLATCTAAGIDVAAVLVEEGLALSSPDYAAEQARAQNARRGLWSGRFVPPRQWRDGVTDDAVPGPMEALWTWFRELTGARSLR